MLTRLKIDGFKNLVDVDILLGPFTCFAGGNGVGKSNIFDAIQFLSLMADRPIADAASQLRNKDDQFHGGPGSVNSLLHSVGDYMADKISLEAEMIIPAEGVDELGQVAEAAYNFLRYTLIIGRRTSSQSEAKGPFSVLKEELIPINKSKANKHLLFNHAAKWRKEVITGKRNVPFISTTEGEQGECLINLHQDGGSSGKPRPFLASKLPRTVLSTARYASETPTVLLARREMQEWKLLHLEPASLRQPDELDKFSSNIGLSTDGAHLPATIYRLAKFGKKEEGQPKQRIYTQLANRLADLIPDVKSLHIDKDEKRQLLALNVIERDGTMLPAKSLSDGTLRFLALAVLDLDYTETGLMCLEEPENGIYPDRISAIIELLQSIPVNPYEEPGEDNPLRQVIINTHSPKVVYEVPEDSLVYVEQKEFVKHKIRFKATHLSALSDTWRTEKGKTPPVSKGKLIAYFNLDDNDYDWLRKTPDQEGVKKVKEREDLSILKQGKLFTT